MKQILIAIYDKIYDVTKYTEKHPGEGIRSTYLRQYNRKNCTKDFEKFHLTNEPDELLIESQTCKSNSGIVYLCPYYSFFKINKIPKYFYNISGDSEIEKFTNQIDDLHFFITPNINNSLLLFFKKNGIVIQINLMSNDNVWSCEINDLKIKNIFVDSLIKEILPNYKPFIL